MTLRFRLKWRAYEDRMLRVYAERYPAHEIARRLRRTEQSVYGRAARLGLPLQKHTERHPRARHSDDDVRAVLRRYFDGESQRAIARSLRIPRGTVSNWCNGSERPHLYREFAR